MKDKSKSKEFINWLENARQCSKTLISTMLVGSKFARFALAREILKKTFARLFSTLFYFTCLKKPNTYYLLPVPNFSHMS